jgi:hypothetical protein
MALATLLASPKSLARDTTKRDYISKVVENSLLFGKRINTGTNASSRSRPGREDGNEKDGK